MSAKPTGNRSRCERATPAPATVSSAGVAAAVNRYDRPTPYDDVGQTHQRPPGTASKLAAPGQPLLGDANGVTVGGDVMLVKSATT